MIPKKILFSTDFSENSRPAGEYALDFARAFGADLYILHVINSSRIGYPSAEEILPIDVQETIARIQESVDKGLALLSDEWKDAAVEVKTYSRIGLPAREVIRFAEEESIELIVMGTHGWTGFKHIIMGSTAENVVRTAKCAVLTVRPAAKP